MSYTHFINDLVTLAVGEEFPFKNPNPGHEGQALITNTDFVTMTFWSQRADTDAQMWMNEKVAIAIYPQAPFLVLGFPNLCADYFVNGCRIDDKAFYPWLDSESNMVTLALVDEATNQLKALRVLAISEAMVNTLKLIVSSNRIRFSGLLSGGAERLDQLAEEVQSRVTGEQMLIEATQAGPDWYILFEGEKSQSTDMPDASH